MAEKNSAQTNRRTLRK